jgi:hypothetical protein
MNVGDVVLLRSLYQDRVRWCFPHRYVGTWDGRLGFYCQPGSHGKVVKRAAKRTGSYIDYWIGTDPPFDHHWNSTNVLRFIRAGDQHTVEVWWDVEWQLLGWYINLQSPTVVSELAIDSIDWALDVDVDSDGTWRWKDEDDLAEIVSRGILSNEQATQVRAEGERVIRAHPWPSGWESWRPPAEWSPLAFPANWSVVNHDGGP